MANILTATVTIKGTRPLLWHHFGPDALPLEKQERTGVAGNDPEEWKRTVLMTKKRQLYIEPTYIFGMCREGARHTKKGKGSIMYDVAATLQVLDEVVYINRFVPREPVPTDRTRSVYVDIRGVKNPTTKMRNVRYRVAASPGWTATFSLIWDSGIVSRDQVRAVLRDASTLVGLGSGRSIGMGRFEVVSFKVAEEKKRATK